MLLKSLRLHPFAGFANRSFDFSPGLNVLLGPNEAGKSTVINALFGVLEMAEKPMGFETAMKGLFLPKTGGDFFRVTLAFEAEEKDYELTWKLSGKTSLELTNLTTGAAFDQDQVIRDTVKAFKTYHQDVYRDVLVIRQGALEAGSQILDGDSFSGKGVDQLLDKLRQRTVAGGGFSPEVMLRQLDVLLGMSSEGYPGRWDFRAHRPEGNRGIENRWRNDVGQITQAYYAWKQAEKDRVEVEDIVHRLERITADNEAAQQTLAKTKAFVEERREEFESQDRLSRLKPELEKWAQARKSLQDKQAEADANARELVTAKAALQTAQETLARFQAQEADMARAKVLNEMRQVVQATETLVRDYKETATEFKGIPEIPKEQVERAKALERDILGLDAKVKAVQLSLQAEAIAGAAAIWIEDENGVRTEVPLAAGELYLQNYYGRVALETGSVRIRVQPATLDTTALLQQKEEKQQAREAILNAFMASSVEDLETRFARRSELERRCNSLTNSITSQTNKPEFRKYLNLETVKLRDLEASLALVDLASLPDPKTWAVEIAQARTAMDKPQADVLRLEDWMRRNPVDKLKSDLQEAESKEQELADRARQEAWFGKEVEPDFLDRYRRAQSQLVQLGESLSKANKEMASLEQQLDGKADLAELHARENQAKAHFEAKLQEYEAYKVIRERLASMMEESDTAVYGPVRERLAHYIGLATGNRYAPAEFEGGALVPSGFVRGELAPFQPKQLSQGTSEAIALATRLALAEFYLEGRKGFLILDDAMVNMDPERVELSATLIQEFASRFQVLYCTCHPTHAQALGGNRLVLDRMA